MQVLNGLPQHVKVVDLSADFRLRSTDMYAEWYGGEHKAPKLQEEAVYGLTEHYREAIGGARLVANPGCYPTSALLPLIPLIKAGVVSKEGLTIDSKSGVSGAGRSAKEANLFCEVADGMHAYGVGKHRHMPEIEQELAVAAGSDVTVSFTPHLIPMSRGMQSTIYVTMSEGKTVADVRKTIADCYKDEYFVRCVSRDSRPIFLSLCSIIGGIEIELRAKHLWGWLLPVDFVGHVYNWSKGSRAVVRILLVLEKAERVWKSRPMPSAARPIYG